MRTKQCISIMCMSPSMQRKEARVGYCRPCHVWCVFAMAGRYAWGALQQKRKGWVVMNVSYSRDMHCVMYCVMYLVSTVSCIVLCILCQLYHAPCYVSCVNCVLYRVMYLVSCTMYRVRYCVLYHVMSHVLYHVWNGMVARSMRSRGGKVRTV